MLIFAASEAAGSGLVTLKIRDNKILVINQKNNVNNNFDELYLRIFNFFCLFLSFSVVKFLVNYSNRPQGGLKNAIDTSIVRVFY